MIADSQPRRTVHSAAFRHIPRELRLLAACCRWPPESAQATVEAMLENLPPDWAEVLALGDRHRVNGFLATALRLQHDVPESVQDVLKRRAEQIERENLLHVAVAATITRALVAAKIPAAIMKGAPLSQVVYRSNAVRHSKDIDLLVEDGNLSSAEVVLVANGFVRLPGVTEGLSPRQVRDFQQFRKHHDYKHSATGCLLELHWRAYDNPLLGSVSLADREWVECLPGLSLPALSRQELFPLLLAHGAGHAWFRLKWLADVAALLAQSAPDEQKQLLHFARERGLQRPAEQALIACAELFDDSRILKFPEASATGRWLAAVAMSAMQQDTKSKSAEADFVPKRLLVSRLLLRSSWKYRLTELKLNAASPADWQMFPLPSFLRFLYPVARLPLWLVRRLRR